MNLSYSRLDGNLAGYDDGLTSASYTYDAVGRKLSETVNYGAFTKSFSYSYYANGLKQSFTAPDGTVYEYIYGSDNELREVRIPGLGSITISEYQWTRPKTVLYPGGSKREYEYDPLMRLKRLAAFDPGGNSLLDYSYEYDSTGNIVSKSTEHGLYSYSYDGASRLTSADNPTVDDESYSYDAVGNRVTASNATGTISHNANNELLVYGDVEYVYDANGNMVQKTLGDVAVNYIYNAENRLVKVEDELTGLVIAEYDYDPFGRRLWKEVGGARTYFLYSDEGLMAEYDAGGNALKTYGYKPNATWTTDPLFLRQGAEYYFYQNDHLGTPQKLIAQNGAVVWSAQYTAFGKAEIQTEMVTNNLRFPGQYFDDETELHYNFQRYYDPGIGRYLSVDPIGFIGEDEINLYSFTRRNPIRRIDPLGLQSSNQGGGMTLCKAYTLKGSFLVEYRLLVFNKDVSRLLIDTETAYFEDIIGKTTFELTPDNKLNIISHELDYEAREWKPIKGWKAPEVNVPEPSVPIDDLKLTINVEGDDVGKVYGIFKLNKKHKLKISGEFHASGVNEESEEGTCAEIEYKIQGSLSFTKGENIASGYQNIEGKVGDCSNKIYCCSREWSRNVPLSGPISKTQEMVMDMSFTANIHVYQDK